MTTRTFNTGRGYTPEGQRIAYTVIDQVADDILPEDTWHTVSFADCDRLIDGTVRILADRDPSPAQVLAAYDAGGYGYDTDRDRVAALYRAAAAHEPK